MRKLIFIFFIFILYPHLLYAGWKFNPYTGKLDYYESGGAVSDTAYNATSWDGVTDTAPSKNAVRDKIESLAGGHDALTLAADAGAIFGLTAQELNLDTQTANYVFAGPTTGAAADPTFRVLVAGDIPDLSSVYQPLDAQLTDLADGTFTGDFVNTAYPWADNEVANDITAGTAAALAADPANCASSGLAGGITAAGVAEACITPNVGTNIANDLEEEVTEGSLADSTITEPDLKAVDAASDEECLTYETTTGDFEWQSCGSGGSGATDLNLPIYSAKLTGAFVVFTPPTADACTAGAGIDAGDGNWRLLFDATVDECSLHQFVIPSNYASTPTLVVKYSMASATANEVEFEAAIMCVTPGDAADIGTASFSNVAVCSDTVPGTAGHTDTCTINLTDDSCAAGDIAFVVLSKDADDATVDDATGDTEVVGLDFDYA